MDRPTIEALLVKLDGAAFEEQEAQILCDFQVRTLEWAAKECRDIGAGGTVVLDRLAREIREGK